MFFVWFLVRKVKCVRGLASGDSACASATVWSPAQLGFPHHSHVQMFASLGIVKGLKLHRSLVRGVALVRCFSPACGLRARTLRFFVSALFSRRFHYRRPRRPTKPAACVCVGLVWLRTLVPTASMLPSALSLAPCSPPWAVALVAAALMWPTARLAVRSMSSTQQTTPQRSMLQLSPTSPRSLQSPTQLQAVARRRRPLLRRYRCRCRRH